MSGTGLSTALRTRVLLVDDHPLVRLGLAQVLATEPDLEVCAEAGDAEAALAAVADHDPDVVVLDLVLGDTPAFDLLRRLAEAAPHAAVVVLTMHDQLVYAERCRQAGARGFVMKDAAIAEVARAVRAVAGGGSWWHDREPTAASGDRAALAARVATLTDRQIEVFLRIGHGRSTRTIAAELGLSAKTVESHKGTIKEKLGAATAHELYRLAVLWREVGTR